MTMATKTYKCLKCNADSSEAFVDPYFKKRFGKVCLWCADLTIDTTRYFGMSRMADAEMGDL